MRRYVVRWGDAKRVPVLAICLAAAELMLGSSGWAQQADVWIPRDLPYKAYSQAATTDLGRGRIVMFQNSTTWEWDGTLWTRRRTAQEPSPRISPSMAYDAARGKVMLFGGWAQTGSYGNDTWEYDGTVWSQANPATSPSPRQNSKMVYDIGRDRTVLIGGSGPGGASYGDMWEWDGATWCTKATPPPTCALYYDSRLARIVVLGYVASLCKPWGWDGTSWTPIPSVNDPPWLGGYSTIGYDQARQRAVYYGGPTGAEQTWEWDGTTWTQRTPSRLPPFGQDLDLVWDPVRQRLVLLGAGTYQGAQPLWEWDGANWTQIPTRTDADLGLAALTYDTARQRAVLVMGNGPGFPGCSTTYEWDGTSWEDRTSTSPCRSGPAAVYDVARQRTVFFGGQDASGNLTNQTWEWDGTTWITRNPPTKPVARQFHSMTYDSARQRVVLFGGSRNSGALDDTWEWDGTIWTLRLPSVSPVQRQWHGLAHDVARAKTVLFGGYAAGIGENNETWEWDGTTWTQKRPSTSPPPMNQPAFAYHAGRQRVMLYGGKSGGTQLGDAWEWDGTNWTKLTFASQPSTGWLMTYDTVRQEMVLTGGIGLDGRSAHTWTLSATVAAAATAYGQGCGGQVPHLDGFGRPSVGNSSFALDTYGGARNAPAAVLLAASAASLPWGSCTVLIDPLTAVALPRLTNGLGFASQRLPIPLQAVLVGAGAACQGAVVDPSAPLGLGLTQGVVLVLGK